MAITFLLAGWMFGCKTAVVDDSGGAPGDGGAVEDGGAGDGGSGDGGSADGGSADGGSGDGGSGDGGSGDGGSTGEYAGSLLFYVGSADDPLCAAGWDFSGAAASTDCPDCEFTLEWAYDVSYALDPGATVLADPCKRGELADLFSDLDTFTAMLEDYGDLHGFVRDLPEPLPDGYDGWIAMGYAYDGAVYFYPLALAKLDPDAGTVRFDTRWGRSGGGYDEVPASIPPDPYGWYGVARLP